MCEAPKRYGVKARTCSPEYLRSQAPNRWGNTIACKNRRGQPGNGKIREPAVCYERLGVRLETADIRPGETASRYA